MRPRTSVLVCNYNNGPFIHECLASVLAQSPSPDEIIVADDGSTDDSLVTLSRFEPRVTVLRMEHGSGTKIQNQARVLQAAFENCTGEIVFLLDGDDSFLPGKIEAYVKAFAADPRVVMVQAPMVLIDGDGRGIGLDIDAKRHWRDPLAEMYRRQEVNIHYATSALAFRRTYLEERFPWVDDLHGLAIDTALAVVAPLHGTVFTMDEPFSSWRRHDNAATVIEPVHFFGETEKKRDYFNRYCRTHSFRPLRRWSSPRYWVFWMRNRLLPKTLPLWARQLRWFFLSDAQRQALLRKQE